MTNETHNALLAAARQCRKEMRGIDKSDLAGFKVITDKHTESLLILGFTKSHLLVEIGRLNGRLTER